MKRFCVLLTSSVLLIGSSAVAQSARDPELREMEERLSTLRLRFTDRHPEVVALLKQIEAYRSTMAPDSPPDPGPQSELQGARARLEELRRTYTDKHPDVLAQIKLIEQLEQEAGQ